MLPISAIACNLSFGFNQIILSIPGTLFSSLEITFRIAKALAAKLFTSFLCNSQILTILLGSFDFVASTI